ncbi:MAG: acyl carrier protein [Magnetococcales bacterium]|nr:acyl carrier protein [Magnetococcales bacterium]
MSNARTEQNQKKLIRIIAEVLRCDPALINENTRLASLPAWNSLANINLIVAVEEQFNIEATPKMLTEMTSFEGIMSILDRLGAS